MKNTFRLIPAVLAAIAVLTGCVQEITSPSFEKDKVNPAAEGSRIIAVSFGSQTKTYLDKDGLQPKFEDGKDTVLISNTNALDTCVVSVKDNKATISTNLTGPLTAVYPYKAAKMNESNLNQIDTILVSTVQSGKFADANICMAKMTSESDESLSFENKTAVFCITPGAGADTKYVEVSAKDFNIANDVPAGSDYKNYDKIHVNTTTADSVYVSILVPDDLKVGNLTFSDGTKVKTVTDAKAATEIEAGALYTVTNEGWESPESDIPDGALKGVFTVSAGPDGKAGTADDVKVYFSQGNLYCSRTSSESSDWSWHFYNEQYNYNSLNSQCDEKGKRTAQITDTEIDFFTWGYNNTTTKDSCSLNPINRAGISGHTSNGENFDTAEDWGSITGLPSAPCSGGWRTLSKDEWTYLLNSRTSISIVSGTADARFLKCKVNDGTTGVYGLMIFPDTFTWPTEAPTSTYINRDDLSWGLVPGYSDTQFAALEAAGVVFLPAAGGRSYEYVDGVGIYGNYWSSTAKSSTEAYSLYFYKDNVNPNFSHSYSRDNGWSVRLVTDVSAAPTPTEPTSEYVEIAADYDNDPNTANTTIKWYRQNLAITDSGKKPWKGGQTEAVKVPGTDKDVIVGDYFQWGAFSGYCGNESDPGKGLLVYDSFTNTCCVDGGSEDAFVSKSDKQFRKANAPYYSGSAYDKYTKINDEGDGKNLLEKADDVANIVLGDTWRMPTSAEFQAMKNATYWAWDGTNKGYYVFKPGQGTKGTAGGRGAINTATDNKADALLFFPAAGRGDNGTSLNFAGSKGYYWSSTLYSENTAASYSLDIDDSGVYPQYYNNRYYGYSVRPVSE